MQLIVATFNFLIEQPHLKTRQDFLSFLINKFTLTFFKCVLAMTLNYSKTKVMAREFFLFFKLTQVTITELNFPFKI